MALFWRAMAAALVALSGQALAACGSDDGPASENADPSARTAAVMQLLEIGYVEGQPSQAQWIAVEESIQRCMQREGFDYWPRPYPGGRPQTMSGEALDPATDGLGLSTRYFDQGFVGPDLAGAEAGGFDPSAALVVDRNEQYRQSLDPSGYDAYVAALEGAAAVEGDDPDPARPGCEAVALDEQGQSFLLDSSLQSELLELLDRYAADPAVIDEARRVEACMAEAGFQIASYGEVLALVTAELDAISSAVEQVGDEVTLSEAGRRSLAALQQQERELAVGLSACGGLPDQTPDELRAVARQLAEEFG